MVFSSLNKFRIALSSNGEIFEICLLSNTISRIAELDYFVEDIVVLQIGDDEIELLLQTKSIESAMKNFKIVEFPCKLMVALVFNSLFYLTCVLP